MDELPAGKGEEDEQGEGDQEGQSGHPAPTHTSPGQVYTEIMKFLIELNEQ